MVILVLLTMPRVTDCDSANGLPMANTVSPTLARLESPQSTAGNSEWRLLSSLSTAISDIGSVPTSVASISSLLENTQSARVAWPATWWLVTT